MVIKKVVLTITALMAILFLSGTGLCDQAEIRHLASMSRIEQNGIFGLLGGVFYDEERQRVYFTDATNGRIMSYDSRFEFISEFKGAEGMIAPVGIVRDSKGRFFVSQPKTGQVLMIDIDQKRIMPLDMSVVPGGNPVYPGALAIDLNDRLYIADRSNQRIILFNPDLRFSGIIPVEGRGLKDVTVDSQGRIYTLNTMDGSVRVHNSHGQRILEFGSRGKGRGEFSFPISLAVDGAGTIYVLDQHLSKVFVFNRSGQFLFDFGQFGWIEGRLRYPSSIYVNKAGKIFIVDQQNARVCVFQ